MQSCESKDTSRKIRVENNKNNKNVVSQLRVKSRSFDFFTSARVKMHITRPGTVLLNATYSNILITITGKYHCLDYFDINLNDRLVKLKIEMQVIKRKDLSIFFPIKMSLINFI